MQEKRKKMRDFFVIPTSCRRHLVQRKNKKPACSSKLGQTGFCFFFAESEGFEDCEAIIVRAKRDKNPRFFYKPFWCCFLLLNSGLIFQIFTFVHTGFTRCLHDFFTLEKFNQYTPFPNFFQNYSNVQKTHTISKIEDFKCKFNKFRKFLPKNLHIS